MVEDKERSTKEKILYCAIDLFAKEGYGNVSVREIAKDVGIKASSLYKHYESKEDILKSIFDLFRNKMEQADFPKEHLEQSVQSMCPEAFLNESFYLFKEVMWEPTLIKIARIITLEQQRSQSVREFFMHELIEKPTRDMQSVFEVMMDAGTAKKMDARILAEEYTAYIIFLYFEHHFIKDAPVLEEIERKMRQHNAFFAKILSQEGR